MMDSGHSAEADVQITGREVGAHAIYAGTASTSVDRAPLVESRSFIDAFDVEANLTANDKVLVGWNRGSDQVNQVAIAVAGYRHSGALTGEISPDFVAEIRNSIRNTGGYPPDPASLTDRETPQSQVTVATYPLLFEALDLGWRAPRS
ncbi:MAG: hypothetical protein B7Y99_13165 [Caulobacterales bacterium 32-69-10]|nr:MAG: hypothetical protein B7Y99_13165 [Caulobacterales bacterium 32-69-10]